MPPSWRLPPFLQLSQEQLETIIEPMTACLPPGPENPAAASLLLLGALVGDLVGSGSAYLVEVNAEGTVGEAAAALHLVLVQGELRHGEVRLVGHVGHKLDGGQPRQYPDVHLDAAGALLCHHGLHLVNRHRAAVRGLGVAAHVRAHHLCRLVVLLVLFAAAGRCQHQARHHPSEKLFF